MTMEEMKIEFHLGITKFNKIHIFDAGKEKWELSLCGKAKLMNISLLKIYTQSDIKAQIQKTEEDLSELWLKLLFGSVSTTGSGPWTHEFSILDTLDSDSGVSAVIDKNHPDLIELNSIYPIYFLKIIMSKPFCKKCRKIFEKNYG